MINSPKVYVSQNSKMLKQPYLALILTLLIGCAESSDSNKTSDDHADINMPDDDKVELFENLHGADTLTIVAKFADCGEWGGHSERIDIYNDNTALKAWYRKDTVNCPNPDLFNRRIVEEFHSTLTADSQVEVMNFIQNILKRSFQNEGFHHAGESYVVTRKDDLKIVYNDFRGDWNGFEELKNKIKLLPTTE